MKILNLFFLLSIAFIACDEVDDPFPENVGISFSLDGNTEYIVEPDLGVSSEADLINLITQTRWDSSESPDNSNQRFMVLEEFTGHTCIFCPAGTKEILRLDSIYGDQLIPVGIHAGGFAVPSPPPYTYDFRVEGGHGEIYLTTFNPGNAYPRGMVSRLTGRSVSSANWAIQINQLKNDAPKVKLAIKNYYSDSLKILRMQIDFEWLSDLSEDYNLQVYLVEDNIIAWQKDGNKEIEDYNHRFVLRKVVNDTYGKSLETAVNGQKKSIQYITSVKSEWDVQNLSSVAFIFNSAESSYEIIQGNTADFP
tara:strand:- start:327 stop:1250 length:924 start_codon:yes stop_codon:yes gene_type:complete